MELEQLRRGRLLRVIARAARQMDVEWVLVRQGGRHEVWRCGSTTIVVPGHAEINELTAMSIQRAREAELGKGWWRR
jgi:hypothetical protein